MAYFILKNLILGPLLRVLFRPWVRGMENIPTSGAAILASNHLSFSDSIFLPLQSRRPVVFLAKSEYFTGKGLKGALTRWFFKATGQYMPEGNIFSSAAQGAQTLGHIPEWFDGTRDADGVFKDVEALLSAMALTNDNLSAAASVSHIARDLYGVGKTLAGH